MTNRRTLIRTMGAGLLLATAHRALANAAGTCEPPACETCGPTGSTTAGPFYVSNAPAADAGAWAIAESTRRSAAPRAARTRWARCIGSAL